MSEMPTHVLRTVRNHRLTVFLGKPPTGEEESVTLLIDGSEHAMTPAAFRQFVACITDADSRLFGAYWSKPTEEQT